jgi:predicted nucleotide-binding protein
MTKYKALAWDDRPEGYLDGLAARFKDPHQVHVDIATERDEFFIKYENELWDFVILDVMDQTSAERPQQVGLSMAERIRKSNKRIPIVLITGEGNAVIEGATIEGPVLPRSKSLTIGDMIIEILAFLKAHTFDYRRVFLISGHNRKAGNIKGRVMKKLESVGLTVDSINPANTNFVLADELVKRMAPCGAFVALCTPDQKIVETETTSELGLEWYQPRLNVILEIGIVMGLTQGLERLVILQRWGTEPNEMAQIPNDLGGKLGIRFTDDHNYEDAIDQLVEALRRMGLRMTSSS